MKKINFDTLDKRNDYSIKQFIGGLEMEFIKKGKNYLIKDSNGIIVSEKEKLEIEKKEMILDDLKSSNCQAKTTKKISKINKKLKELDSVKETDKTV